MIEFLMPSLGADMEDGTLVAWRKKEGSAVKRGDIVAEVDTQKGLIEIEIFDEGILEKMLVQPGTKVPVGTPLALISPGGAGVKMPPMVESKEEMKPPVPEKIPKAPAEIIHKGLKVSPLARRIAEDNKIDLSTVTGTGDDGAITKADVEKAIVQRAESGAKQAATGIPAEDKTKAASDTIRNAVAAAMSRANREIPHYYLEKAIDMTKAMAWLERTNKERPVNRRLLPAVLLIKSTALALQEVPELNAVWDNGLQLKQDIHIGFVVSLRGGGIIVPAIHTANLRTLDEIMDALNDIIPRAKALKLRSSELSDSTVTVTYIGEGGADSVFGIIYPPQVALVGFGSISEQPFSKDGMLGIHPIMRVTLAADHRATDGLTGSRFLTALNSRLQIPESL